MKNISPLFLLLFCLYFFSCTKPDYISKSELRSKDFISNKTNNKIELIKLCNKNGMEICITNYGARIVSIMAPDKNGKFDDVVCGFDNINDYINIKQNFGALVGRYIGRILNARFTINDSTYHLQASGNGHCSHGGNPGFANKVWNRVKKNRNSVQLSYLSIDGENGFPGNLKTFVTYSLSDNNELIITYKATTDKPTVLNLSNHSFFNLSGNLSKSIVDEKLWINSDSIAEYDSKKCVTGKFLAVNNSPFDFRKPKLIGLQINDNNPQLNVTKGYDHAFQLKNRGNIKEIVAKLTDDSTGITMEVYTTEPAVQIYTANGHNGSIKGKHGITYPFRNAICFETMHYADSPNNPQLPNTSLFPGEEYNSKTIFKFGISDNK